MIKTDEKTMTITLEEIINLYNEFEKRDRGYSFMTKYDGTRVSTDTGYAIEGIEFFIEEIKHFMENKKVI